MSTTYQRQGSEYTRSDTGTLVVRAPHTVRRKSTKTQDPRMVHLARQAANKNALEQAAAAMCNLCGAQSAIAEWENADVCEECYFTMHDRYRADKEAELL